MKSTNLLKAAAVIIISVFFVDIMHYSLSKQSFEQCAGEHVSSIIR